MLGNSKTFFSLALRGTDCSRLDFKPVISSLSVTLKGNFKIRKQHCQITLISKSMLENSQIWTTEQCCTLSILWQGCKSKEFGELSIKLPIAPMKRSVSLIALTGHQRRSTDSVFVAAECLHESYFTRQILSDWSSTWSMKELRVTDPLGGLLCVYTKARSCACIP